MRFETNGTLLDLTISELVIAGWTGRDEGAIRHHIEELAAIGVAPPSATPLFYRVSADLLTHADHIQVVGSSSSGEVEPMIVQHGGRRWLGLGSDHTDRALEAHSVAFSKQACAKPCARQLWPWEQVAGHLDRIELQGWVREDGDWRVYQRGSLAAIRPLDQLIAGAGLDDLAATGAAAMMCGTLATEGGLCHAARFRVAMRDLVSGQEIAHEYATIPLPEIA